MIGIVASFLKFIIKGKCRPNLLYSPNHAQEYDWGGSEVTASLDLPMLYMDRSIDLGIDWTQYKTWPVVQLTQNYMLLQMSLLRQDNGMVWYGMV